EPALIVGDEMRGGAEDVGGGAVVALQADDRGAREILVEAQDVVDLGAAPAVDRLIIISDAADVDGRLTLPLAGRVARRAGWGWCRLRRWRGGTTPLRPLRGHLPRKGGGGLRSLRPLRQQAQPHVLR